MAFCFIEQSGRHTAQRWGPGSAHNSHEAVAGQMRVQNKADRECATELCRELVNLDAKLADLLQI